MTPGETDKPQLVGGELLAAISKMIVSILREHYGRGPMKAKTYVMDDLVVCVLRNGFIAIEETMMQQGREDEVLEMRHDFQRMMGSRSSSWTSRCRDSARSSSRPTRKRKPTEGPEFGRNPALCREALDGIIQRRHRHRPRRRRQ